MSKIGTANDAQHLEVYDSWTEFVDRATSPLTPDMEGGDMGKQKESHDRGADWSGTKTFDQAVAQAREGWPEGRQRIGTISEALFAKTGSLIQNDDVQYEVTGTTIDIGTFLSGQPECFTEWVESDNYGVGKGKLVKIIMNVATSSGISADVTFVRGAAAVALAESLERAGRRAEIWLVMNVRGGAGGAEGNGTEYRVCVKRPDQQVQIDQLAFSMASPAAFRRIGFAVMEHWPKSVQEVVGPYYGYPMDSKMEGDIVVPSASYGDSQWESTDGAVGWVIDNLREQGIIIPEEGE